MFESVNSESNSVLITSIFPHLNKFFISHGSRGVAITSEL